MLNLCHIFSLKRKKICAFVLIACLISGLTPAAESVSVKLRGKMVLGGILSGLAYATYALVKRDKRATEALQLHLGPPDRVIQFERGFDQWRINYYRDQCYLFRNNRLVGKKALKVSCSSSIERLSWKTFGLSPFLTDMPVSVRPKWLRLCLLHPQRAPQFVSSYLYRSGVERLLGPRLSLSR